MDLAYARLAWVDKMSPNKFSLVYSGRPNINQSCKGWATDHFTLATRPSQAKEFSILITQYSMVLSMTGLRWLNYGIIALSTILKWIPRNIHAYLHKVISFIIASTSQSEKKSRENGISNVLNIQSTCFSRFYSSPVKFVCLRQNNGLGIRCRGWSFSYSSNLWRIYSTRRNLEKWLGWQRFNLIFEETYGWSWL